MTPLEIALTRIEIINPPFPVRLQARGRGDVLAVIVKTVERDSSEPSEFVHSFPVPLRMLDPAAQLFEPVGLFGAYAKSELLRWIADRVRAVFIHEFHECFRVDRLRMFEPHPDAEPGATQDMATRYDFSIGPTMPPRARF